MGVIWQPCYFCLLGSQVLPSRGTVHPPEGYVVTEMGKVSHGASSPFRLETRATFSPVPRDLDYLILYVLGEALLKRLSNHGDLIPSQKGNE